MSDEIAIRVENVTKIYKLYASPTDRLKDALNPFRRKYHRNFHALNDISFEIKRGETVGIIGQNGAGKSTLLKIITGIINPSSGRVQVHGRISALLELGAGFNPDISGLENVYFNGTILGFSKEQMDSKLDEIIAFADIGDFIHQPVKLYSSGMSARLAFALAINVEPEILIIDEALAVGDVAFQMKCFRRIKDFLSKGITVIIVSHSIDSIIRYCTRGIVIDNGCNMFDSTAKEAVDVYKKILAKSFVEFTDETAANDTNISLINKEKIYKSAFNINPSMITYGNKCVEIVDFAIFDSSMVPTTTLFNGDSFSVYMKIRFNRAVNEPIYAYTIRDLKGMDITGTNTFISHLPTGPREKGEVIAVKFSQVLNLKADNYSLCLGCTEYIGDELEIYHRLYDVLIINAISKKAVVGIFDPQSEITISTGA